MNKKIRGKKCKSKTLGNGPPDFGKWYEINRQDLSEIKVSRIINVDNEKLKLTMTTIECHKN